MIVRGDEERGLVEGNLTVGTADQTRELLGRIH